MYFHGNDQNRKYLFWETLIHWNHFYTYRLILCARAIFPGTYPFRPRARGISYVRAIWKWRLQNHRAVYTIVNITSDSVLGETQKWRNKSISRQHDYE